MILRKKIRVLLATASVIFLMAGCGTHQSAVPVPVFHFGDIFRPVGDPDGHHDLACEFAMSKKGLTDLKGVVIDANACADINAVAQLNYITASAVPVTVWNENGAPGDGLLLFKNVLENSPQPVSVTVQGRCTEIAEAYRLWPELFRDKVRCVYLNAGAGEDAPGLPLEYNVSLDTAAYRSMFSLPCPVYWLPCFNTAGKFAVEKHGSFFAFRQKILLENAKPEIFNFFRSVLQYETTSDWLQTLEKPVDPKAMEEVGALTRNMWCTAGILHSAGRTVWKDGTVAPLGERPDLEVFRFIPVSVSCSEEGHTCWKPDESSDNRYLIEITDVEQYGPAMTRALCDVIGWL